MFFFVCFLVYRTDTASKVSFSEIFPGKECLRSCFCGVWYVFVRRTLRIIGIIFVWYLAGFYCTLYYTKSRESSRKWCSRYPLPIDGFLKVRHPIDGNLEVRDPLSREGKFSAPLPLFCFPFIWGSFLLHFLDSTDQDETVDIHFIYQTFFLGRLRSIDFSELNKRMHNFKT